MKKKKIKAISARPEILVIAIVILSAVFAPVARGQYSITWYTVDGGGGVSTGGSYTIMGTAGQPDAGENNEGVFDLLGGFWSGWQKEIVSCTYTPGDRVVLLVSNPRGATNLPGGKCGTVLCMDTGDPSLPVLVSWDRWSGGYNRDTYCDETPPRYPNNSAYWMACDQIAPGCKEGYFDKCGVFVRVGSCVFFDADGGGRYLVDTYDFQVGDYVRVRGLLVAPCLTLVCGPPNGCIESAIVSYCDGYASTCCGSDYGPGNLVRLLVNNPRGALGLVAGTIGTVICCDYDDPDLPVFVSWHGWTNGRNTDQYCDTTIWTYPANSGWWMACDQITPVGLMDSQ